MHDGGNKNKLNSAGLQLNYSYICIEMGTHEKLIERFKAIPSDFTFDELERLLNGFGYERLY